MFYILHNVCDRVAILHLTNYLIHFSPPPSLPRYLWPPLALWRPSPAGRSPDPRRDSSRRSSCPCSSGVSAVSPPSQPAIWTIWLLEVWFRYADLQGLMRLQDLGQGAPPRALEQVDGEVLSQGPVDDKKTRLGWRKYTRTLHTDNMNNAHKFIGSMGVNVIFF